MADLCFLSATELLDAYRKHELSPVEVTRAVLERIKQLNPVANAFNLVSDHALEDAKASEVRWLAGQPKGLLDGVPAPVKPIILPKGWPTRPSSKTANPNGPRNTDRPAARGQRQQERERLA